MSNHQSQLRPLEAFIRNSLTHMEAYAYLLQAQLIAKRKEHADLAKAYEDLHRKVKGSYADSSAYFLSSLFVSQVADFELFLQDTATAVVLKNPKKVGSTTFALSEILDSPTPDALIRRAIDDWLNKIMYKRPAEYLKEFASILSIDEAPLLQKWPAVVEAKARRDVGLHHDWKCNGVYLRKVAEVGAQASANIGESLTPSPTYFRATNETLIDLGVSIGSAVISKHWPETDISKLDFTFSNE